MEIICSLINQTNQTMKLNFFKAAALGLLIAGVYSCQDEALQSNVEISDEVISKIESLGFNPDGTINDIEVLEQK